MADYDEVMGGLRARVQQVIGNNAVVLAQHGVGPSTKAPTPPERQWWNFAAKKAAGERIAEEERRRSIEGAKAVGLPDAHDNAFDAIRHARWSQRMAAEIGPMFAGAAGVKHEIDGLLEGQPLAEAMMDLRNNAEGRRAAREHRPIDPARLQTTLGGPAGPGAAYRPPGR